MDFTRPSRREALLLGLAAAAAPSSALAQRRGLRPMAASDGLTRIVQTTGGLVRGLREPGVAKFLGIPYGANTGTRRFLPPVAIKPWRGMRDCTALGAQAVQGSVGAGSVGDITAPLAQEVMRRFKSTMEGSPGSENCLFLNVWTSSADPLARRPVMVWLHGGGFAIGSGGDAQYDGAGLVRRGDVVVVTLNHRLNALGYLYLGDLHADFADSGNAGTLDQVLALEWVRDNIAEFGGDPNNVTLFGQSGGGSKVSAMLAVPAARGLFHKAIVQSGPGLRMADKGVAAQIAEKTLASLGIDKADVRKLQTADVQAVIKAASASAAQMRDAMRTLAPVVDGRTLPADPFEPAAPAMALNIPLMIGSTKDEATLFSAADRRFPKHGEDDIKARFNAMLRDRGPAALDLFKANYPKDAPSYWLTSMMTQTGTWMNSIRLAERKVAQRGAPVWMYRFDWHPPIIDGALRSPHGTDVPLVFDTTESASLIMGTDGSAKRIAAKVSQAWIDFARSGIPSQAGLAWPPYEPERRQTMIFDNESRVVADPDGAMRRFWSQG